MAEENKNIWFEVASGPADYHVYAEDEESAAMSLKEHLMDARKNCFGVDPGDDKKVKLLENPERIESYGRMLLELHEISGQDDGSIVWLVGSREYLPIPGKIHPSHS